MVFFNSFTGGGGCSRGFNKWRSGRVCFSLRLGKLDPLYIYFWFVGGVGDTWIYPNFIYF
jgi:hypothetical protein